MSEPTNQRSENQTIIRNLVIAITIWGALLALGSFLFPFPYNYFVPGKDQVRAPLHLDIRKPLIVLTCVALFLGGWMFMLRRFMKRRGI